MFDLPGLGKRRASDSAQIEADVEEASGKRRRVEESGRSSSLPECQEAAAAVFCTPPLLPESSSSFPSPATTQEQANTFTSPAQFRTLESQLSVASSYHPCFSGVQQQLLHTPAGWNQQASMPGCSDVSEQTMEDVHSTPHQTPQTSTIEQQTPQWGMALPPQRSNSAPDLRVLLSGPVNAIPPAIVARGPMESRSMTGALVPFKAPEEVIEDAVRHMLKSGLKAALENPKPGNDRQCQIPLERVNLNANHEPAPMEGVEGMNAD